MLSRIDMHGTTSLRPKPDSYSAGPHTPGIGCPDSNSGAPPQWLWWHAPLPAARMANDAAAVFWQSAVVLLRRADAIAVRSDCRLASGDGRDDVAAMRAAFSGKRWVEPVAGTTHR
jgi:hypothetical protein